MRHSLAILLVGCLPCSSYAVELADLVRQTVATGAPASGQLTGESAARVVKITRAQGDINATASVLGPLPAGKEVCRHVRIVFDLANVETRDGTLVPYTQTLTMPWCPSLTGYQALKGTPGLFRVGR